MNARVLEAMRRASDAMKFIGVRHIVVGALAVGAHGYPRATGDVNFLVGDEAFERHPGGVVTLRVPIQVNGVAVDYLSVGTDEQHLGDAISAEPGSFASAPVLVYLKLKSPRAKDRTDSGGEPAPESAIARSPSWRATPGAFLAAQLES